MEQQFLLNKQIRGALKIQLESLSLEQLNYVPRTHNNNIFWNVAHRVAVQQALCYRLSGLPTPIAPDLVAAYSKGTQPNGSVDQAMVDRTKTLLESSLEILQRDWTEGKFERYKPYTVALGTHLTDIDQVITFNNLHESIHYGYILALKKLL